MLNKTKKINPKVKDKFPKVLLVMSIPFDIVWKENLENYGECDGSIQEIMLSEFQTEKQAEHTLLHEYIHASLAVCGLDELLTDELNEAVTKCLTSAFYNLVDIRQAEIKLK